MEINKIYQGDCKELIKNIPDNMVDAIITDPPYELGFMGKKWDKSGIAYDAEVWSQCLRVLKPGGHLLAFSGTRTYHRMVCAIEDAGFEIRDMVEWVYGSGFPKSLNIGKAVDKLQGNERDVIGLKDTYREPQTTPIGWVCNKREKFETNGTSEWEGWGTALKPAHEPIVMARKPLSENTVAENCLKWGTGAINIDESRIGIDKMASGGSIPDIRSNSYENSTGKARLNTPIEVKQGRFPANLIHDNSEEVRACFPDTGPTKPHGGDGQKLDSKGMGWGFTRLPSLLEDGGGSSLRFFKSIMYTAKASGDERNEGLKGMPLKEPPGSKRSVPAEGRQNALGGVRENFHPTVKPLELMVYLIKMVTRAGGVVLDPFIGSGTTAVACKMINRNFIGFELNKEYFDIANGRISKKTLFDFL